MHIGELAERSGASARSIRHYESVGLLTSRRSGNGYRDFDAGAVEQVAKIKLLLQVGLDITDIVAVLPCVDNLAQSRCEHAQRRFDEHIARIERQQALLAQAKSLLLELRSASFSELGPPPGNLRVVSGNRIAGLQ
ncbi:MerR family transcriptional regulator [Nocardia sp. NPDC004582]